MSTASVLKNLTKLEAFTPNAFAAALYQEATVVLGVVVQRTPIDFGPLRASEHLEGPTREGRRIFVTIAAGGPSAPYALIVHEDPDAHHKVGTWKYVEHPIKEAAPTMAARIAARIDLTKAL